MKEDAALDLQARSHITYCIRMAYHRAALADHAMESFELHARDAVA